jgi:hypothetical protein
VAGQPSGAVVAEIGLLGAAAGVREVQPHRRPFSFCNFHAAVVADEHCLACQVDLLGSRGKPSSITPVAEILRSFSRTANSIRPKQRENRLLFRVEADISRADDAQMTWPKVINRSSVEILLDDSRADMRRARNCGRIPEALADAPHHRRDHAFRLGFRLGDAVPLPFRARKRTPVLLSGHRP